MPFRFTCPHCQHATTVEDRIVGQSGECAVCGKAIVVARDDQQRIAPRAAAGARGTGMVQVVAILIALAGVSGIGVFLVVAMFMAAPTATTIATVTPGQQMCSANLSRIGRAMLDYHTQYGRFPPAYTLDENGKPMHSWRLLLLPHLGEYNAYQQYNRNQPWDAPENSWAVRSMPPIYVCPDDKGNSGSETNYLVVTGPGTVFDGANSVSQADITDGPENTILVIEVVSSSQLWHEPRELDRDSLSLALNTGGPREIGSYHTAGGAHALMADGSVKFISDLTPPQVLEAMLTIDAGDVVDQ